MTDKQIFEFQFKNLKVRKNAKRAPKICLCDTMSQTFNLTVISLK